MTLTEIKKLSPVKIMYAHSVNGEGQYHFTAKCIIIDKDLKRNTKIECLLHEIGHAIHHANNCRCMTAFNHTLAEYHAMRFAMKHIKSNSALIKIFVDKINLELETGDFEHRSAAEQIVKLKQWAKFCKII